MDIGQMRDIAREALSDVPIGRYGVSAGTLRIRRIDQRSSFAWIVGFWFRSYAPDVEVLDTDALSPSKIRAQIVGKIEDNIEEWKRIADSRQAI